MLPYTTDKISSSTFCIVEQTCSVQRTKTSLTSFKAKEQKEKALLPQFSFEIIGLDIPIGQVCSKTVLCMVLNSETKSSLYGCKAVMTHPFPCISGDDENYLGLFTAAMHR